MAAFSFRSPDAETTLLAARLLGRGIPSEGLVVALVGPLGAGKTVFVKGLGEGLGLDPDAIASPTFAIAAEYPPSGPGTPGLVHVDLYRVKSELDLEAVGWLDWLGARCVLAVEWSDRFPDALPRGRLEVRLGRGAAGSVRSLDVRPSGPHAEACARAWRAALVAAHIECVDHGPAATSAAERREETESDAEVIGESETESRWR